MSAPVRIKTWVSGDEVSAADLETEFNVAINALADGTKDLTQGAVTCTNLVTSGNLTNPGSLIVAGASTLTGAANITGTTTFAANISVPNATFNGTVALGNAAANTITMTGTLSGLRSQITFGASVVGTDITFSDTKMHRAGSIVGYSIHGKTTSWSSSYVSSLIAKGGGAGTTTLFTTSALTFTANTQFKSAYASFARNTYAFVAGDIIVPYWDYTSGSATMDFMGVLYIQWDT